MVSKMHLVALMGVAVMASLWQLASSHGRLIDPPARSTMWRYGYKTPKNYQDNELFCGGLFHQINQGYKCGICGDPWDSVRPHEAGGYYAKGIIVATYDQESKVDISVQITANHKGWFEFKICPTNNASMRATQECLDAFPVQLADGSGTKFYVSNMGNAVIKVPVQLPKELNCDFCVLQWHYHTGNSWGVESDGKGCLGCGYQEEFYGCADVKILPSGVHETTERNSTSTATSTAAEIDANQTTTNLTISSSMNQTTTIINNNNSTTNANKSSSSSSSSSSTPVNSNTTTKSSGGSFILTCQAYPPIPKLVEWCNTNCNMDFCPASHCKCAKIAEPRAAEVSPGCYATSPFEHWPGMDEWCFHNCKAGFCPDNMCFCTK